VRLPLLTMIVFLIVSAAATAQTASQPTPTDTPIVESARAKVEATTTDGKTEAPKRHGAAAPVQDPEPAPKRTRLQVGVSLKSTTTPGVDTNDSIKPTFIWRWRGKGSRLDDRWAPAYRLSSFSSRVSSQLGNTELPVGDVKVQPVMLGLDYKMPRGKWNFATGMSLGWALNNIETPGEYNDRVVNTTGVQDLWVDVHNSLVWGPRFKGWYDRDRRLSYMIEAAYLVTRPELDVRANGVTTTRRLNADALILKAGIVYGIF
jgi:hypothetical protein